MYVPLFYGTDTMTTLPTRYTSDPDVLSNPEERRIVQSLWDNYFHQTTLALLSDTTVAEVVKQRETAFDACRSLRPSRYLSDPEVLENPDLFAEVQSAWDTYLGHMRDALQRFPYTEEELRGRDTELPVVQLDETASQSSTDTESLPDVLIEDLD
jgi:hypothetical protein